MDPKAVVSTFPHSKFEPARLIAYSRHWQTIVGSGALHCMLFGRPPRPFNASICERFDTPDGDFFDVEYTDGFENPNGEKSVIILHGLEGTTRGPLVTLFATAMLSNGFSCCLVSFRSCSGEKNRTPGAYHLGFTDDLHQLVAQLHTRYPARKLYICGYSLGGNIALKFLGELGDHAEARGVFGAATTGVPFDPAVCQAKMDVGFNKLIYSSAFLATMKAKAEVEHQRFPEHFDIQEVRACETICAFDGAYLAKIYKFKDLNDYYRSSGAKWWLHKIRVPAIAINARDDPFIEEESLPTDEHVGEHAPVRLIYPQHGGHCGFYTAQQYMGYEGGENEPVPAHGWLAEELARFLDHVHGSCS